MEDEMLVEILKEMQKKYQCVTEIERNTRDMGEALSRNDRTSVQLLIGMRQEEMDKADLCERNIRCLISALPDAEAIQVANWMKGIADQEPLGRCAELIVEKGNSIRHVLKRTLEIDRHISTRLAGKDSFYK